MWRDVYLTNSIGEIPRILSLTDRNVNSPTYGCMYRVFWHDKATDTACAHPQLNVLALALASTIKRRDNPYYMNAGVIEVANASMNFWASIQNKDGSFNEHYPNEHSYGATAWTLSSVVDSYLILNKFMERKNADRVIESMAKAGNWLGKNEDPGPLTNHQAIAAWALYRLFKLTKKKKFFDFYQKGLKNVFDNQSEEGWYIEYDGPDLGYLTTSISFMAKLYRETADRKILESLKRALEFSSYFVYPDKSFGGPIGYRDTSHFHPHGFELMAGEIPAAAAVKSAIIGGLQAGRILTPAAMDDKYFGNLAIEFLRSYADYTPVHTGSALPHKRGGFIKHFEDSKIFVERTKNYYFVCNMAKGGVFKLFRKNKTVNDSGLAAVTRDGRPASSSWRNGEVEIVYEEGKIKLKTNFFIVTKNRLSTDQLVASRLVMSTAGRHPLVARLIKGALIKRMITTTKKLRPTLEREITLDEAGVRVKDTVRNKGRELSSISPVGSFFHRYVPASRYFEPTELGNVNYKFKRIGDKAEFKRKF